MKKNFILTLAFLFVCIVGYASNALYDFSLTGGKSIPSSSDYVTLTAANGSTVNYTQNLQLGQTIDYLSFQAIYSSVTFSVTTATLTQVNSVTNVITSTANYPAGFALLYTSSTYYSAGTYGLTNNTTYYAFNPTATSLQLSTGTAAGQSAVIVGTGTIGSFTLTPINIQASSPFSAAWYSSNDNRNWYAVNATSITILGTTGATNIMWDFQFATMKYLRFAVATGTFGAIQLNLRGYGKRVAP